MKLEASYILSRFGSLFIVSGENAGRQIATYSAPPSSGVLYRTHSPLFATTASPAWTSSCPASCSTRSMPRSTSVTSSKAGRCPGSVQPCRKHAAQYERDLIEGRPLSGFRPALG